MPEKAKNIIICADGTGNKGGYTPDSNVYAIYNAIEIHDTDPEHPEQIRFYDNGVGTAANKYLKGITGAFGIGFGKNIRDLYEFLARNYDPEAEDKIFLFGFSRGAATVRALSGFIAACGLVDGRKLEYDTLRKKVKEAFKVYQSPEKNTSLPEPRHDEVPIHFIGVWDTVGALGWPPDWKNIGLGITFLNLVFKTLDAASELIPATKHKFYNYELTDNVKFAYQALAMDDERQTFKPMVWDEVWQKEDGTVEPKQTEIEQVWFAGVHSNVGGGYERAGLAGVALEWMMTRAKKHGLRFKNGAVEEATSNADVHGQLYNSRDGFAVYYRYYPREIEQLCKDEKGRERMAADGVVKIHASALQRMQRQTANYAPGHFPDTFDVVDTPLDAASIRVANPAQEKGSENCWTKPRQDVDKLVASRKRLHGIFVEFTAVLAFVTLLLWNYPLTLPENYQPSGFLDGLAGVLKYILPAAFDGLITAIVLLYPIVLALMIAFLIGLYFFRTSRKNKNEEACERVRSKILKVYEEAQSQQSEASSPT